MQYLINFSESLEILTAFMTFFLGIHLISFKPQSSIKWMGVFLLTLSLKTSSSLLITNQVIPPLQVPFGMWLSLPIFYYFLSSIIALATPHNKPAFIKWVWLLPWLLIDLHNAYWLRQTLEARLYYLNTSFFGVYNLVVNLFSLILVGVLIFWWFGHPQKPAQRIPTQEATWIKILFGFLLLLGAESFLKACVWLINSSSQWTFIIHGLSQYFCFAMVCGLGFAIFQKVLFFHEFSLITKPAPPQSTHGVFNQEQQEIYEKLEQLVNTAEVYANPNLTLLHLAKKLEVKKQVLTKVIYQHTGSHYYDYINHLRVEKFKEMLTSNKNQHLSIEGMAKELGFKSKATLYKYFKKSEGTTPAKYKQTIIASDALKK